MLLCEFNPCQAAKIIPYPSEWCNVIWGYCQFLTEYHKEHCPIRHAYKGWFNYWFFSLKDDRKVLIKYKNIATPVEYTVLYSKYTCNDIERINIIYDPGEDPEKREITTEEGMLLLKTFDVTMLDTDTHDILSLGKSAMKDTLVIPDLEDATKATTFSSLNLSKCLYLGDSSLNGCDNLETITFEDKTDDYIPILESVNALYTSNQNINADITILVPKRLEAEWKAAENWSVFADQIKGI